MKKNKKIPYKYIGLAALMTAIIVIAAWQGFGGNLQGNMRNIVPANQIIKQVTTKTTVTTIAPLSLTEMASRSEYTGENQLMMKFRITAGPNPVTIKKYPDSYNMSFTVGRSQSNIQINNCRLSHNGNTTFANAGEEQTKLHFNMDELQLTANKSTDFSLTCDISKTEPGNSFFTKLENIYNINYSSPPVINGNLTNLFGEMSIFGPKIAVAS